MFHRRRLIFIIVLVVAVGTLAPPTLAQNRQGIRIVNEHPNAELMVGAYDVNDWLMGVACQHLPYRDTKERTIHPWTSSGLDKLFNDHCGNYDKLKLSFNARVQGYNSNTGAGYTHFAAVEVPWGATVTFRADKTLSCTGCDWTTKSK